MRYSLIGCGRVSPEHIRAAKANGLTIVGLCDVDPLALEENLGFAMDFLGGVPFYTDYRDMLTEQNPQLVAIATPSGLHAWLARECMKYDAHVIIEKPIAMNLKDAQKITSDAEAYGLIACCCFQNRFNPAVRALKSAVDAGRFGKIHSASMQLRWHRGEDYYRQAAWRGTREHDGGAMMNQGIHGIDLLNWMLGEPKKVTALTARLAHDIEMEDVGMAAVQYENGALAQIQCETLRYPGAEEEVLELNGEHGAVRLGGIAGHLVETWRFDDAPPNEEAEMKQMYAKEPETVYGHGHTLLYQDALEAIAQGRPPLAGTTEGARALRIILGAYESAATGKAVRL
ncbi:MAG: Gfo/Idh/MocA family oxidoreductase [Oscillospiraceae bacterium]|jgi:predicted dehydrogenase|nr:Gfo/Idh/MocA family oxidoreductase [Oscillospiraceae bacterium]